MNKRSVYLIILLAVVFVFSSIAVSWADGTQCLVVRRINPPNALTVARVDNGVVGPFIGITGLFTSQPTVIWDEDTQRYYLYGTGLLGGVFRRTLDANCNTLGGWVKLTGDDFSASPIGAAGGGRHQTFNSINAPNTNVQRILTSIRGNITSMSVFAPDDGFFLCRTSGTIEHVRGSTTGNVFSRVHLATSSAGTSPAFQATQVPSGGPTGSTVIPVATERFFSTGPGSRSFFVTGEEGGSAQFTTTTNARIFNLSCQFHPYAF